MPQPRPLIHTIVYGDPGSGKSTFASTFPKPMLVLMFDPLGKDTPYVRRGARSSDLSDEGGVPVREVFDKHDNLIACLEYYLDGEVTGGDVPQMNPTAYYRFLKRMGHLHHDLPNYATLVLDSVTFMEIAARKWSQYKLNPNTKEPRQWYSSSTEALEEVLMLRFGALQCNIVVTAHISEKKDEVHGFMIRNIAAPGRLEKRLSAAYGEVYRASVAREADGTSYVLQTRSDRLFMASTQIEAPDPCQQHYQALWAHEMWATS